MRKKLIITALLVTVCMVLAGCKGSKNIQGEWFAQDSDEMDCKLIIDEDSIKVKGDTEKVYSYKQHMVGTENGVTYYGIMLDGEEYSVVFPEKGVKDKGLILKVEGENKLSGTLVYALNSEEPPSFFDYLQQYMS